MSLCCWLEGLDGSRRRVGPDGLLLGRGGDCAFRTLDTRVSVRHAEVTCRDQGVFLTPRGVIPTVLNGNPIHNPRQLSDGDWISLAPGVLFRVITQTMAAVQWQVHIDDAAHSLTPGGPALPVSSHSMLHVHDDATLQLSFQEPITLRGAPLQPDRRPWALEEGDVVVLSDSTRLQVTAGPTRAARPPTVWSLSEPLRYNPPRSARLTGQRTLRLSYPDASVEVQIRDGTLLSTLLNAEGSLEVAPPALLRLQEDLIRGGIDGFCLLPRTAAGVRLQLSDDTQERRPPLEKAPGAARAWWVQLSDCSRLWLDSGGVLIGRNPDCDIRYDRPYIHRYHALIRQRAGQAELVPLGQNPCYIDGLPISHPTILSAGARVTIEPSAWLELNHAERPTVGRARCTVSVDGVDHTLESTAILAGGGSEDSLHVAGWPAGAICLFTLAEAVFCEPHVAAKLDGLDVQPRRAQRLLPGQVLTINGQDLTLLSHTAAPSPSPRMVLLQPFQSAGRLLFRFDDRSQIRVCLPHRRYQLMQLLLESYVGSRLRGVTRTRSPDSITNEDLPRGAAHTRDLQLEVGGSRRLSLSALSDILHQTRTDLIRAGINGERMLESSEDWARLHLGESCNVTLYS